MANCERHPLAGRIVAAARGYVGVCFRRQGRCLNGLDCVGLVAVAARGAGIAIDIPAWLPYRGLAPGEVERLFLSQGFVATEHAAAGDVVLRWAAARQPHVAIRTDIGIVEAHAGVGRVVERNLDAAEQWHAAWRFPGKGTIWLR